MRGILLGLVLLPVLAVALLSIRPGGLRRQLRSARRRLKVAIVLGGVYLGASTAGRFALGDRPQLDYALAGLAALLAIIFVILGQDERAARSPTEP